MLPPYPSINDQADLHVVRLARDHTTQKVCMQLAQLVFGITINDGVAAALRGSLRCRSFKGISEL